MDMLLQARTLKQAGSILLESNLKTKYYLEYWMHPDKRQETRTGWNNQAGAVNLINTFIVKHAQDRTEPGEVVAAWETFQTAKWFKDAEPPPPPALSPKFLYFLLGTASWALPGWDSLTSLQDNDSSFGGRDGDTG